MALAALAAFACGGRKPAPPPPAEWNVTVAARGDCLYHAVAAAALPDAWLLVAACGSTGAAGTEEILAVRVDERGAARDAELVHLLEAGWATNVLVAPIQGGGAVVAWTSAERGEAWAWAAPVDVQGRRTGEPIRVGRGRALGMSGGPGGAALAVVAEPEELSDDVAAPGAVLTLYALAPDAKPSGSAVLSKSARAGRPYAAVAARPGGYVVTWVERDAVLVAETGPFAEAGARGAATPPPVELKLPEGTSFDATAILAGGAGDAARVAALARGEVWLGDGTIGGAPASWRWRVVAPAGPRRDALAAAGAAAGPGALAWTEPASGADFAVVRLLPLRADGSAPAPPGEAVAQAVLLDGAVALAARGSRVVAAGAVPPLADGAPSVVAVRLVTLP